MIHPRTLLSLEFNKIVDHLIGLCNSPAGRKLAQAASPLATQAEAEEALLLYDQTRTWANESARNVISSYPDVASLVALVRKKRHAAASAQNFTLDLEAFWALREMLHLGREIIASIKTPQAPHSWPLLLACAEKEEPPIQLMAALDRCLSDDGFLKDESSPELFRLRNELRKLHQSCMKKVREYAQQYNMLAYLQDDFMTLSSDRYVLPLKANFKGRMQGIIHDWSQTGETCYFEPYFLVEINNRLQELKHEEREEERKILQYLTSLLDSELPGVESMDKLLGKLDYLQAVRLQASQLDALPPAFCDAGDGIELLQTRHPLLTLSRLNLKDSNPVRPIDIILRKGERALIITGGNAGGKTVCLKTLGLLSAMAMSGLPIPAAPGSRLPWFERIDAFIGDEQSLTENVSTFSAQIDHLAKAFKHLGEHGLALLDEFGAGTDPAEGAALAQATHDELLEKQCFVLSATHFPALKSYALSKPGVRAATMLFDPKTRQPLFKLAYDQVGSSQALTVAAEHGLPESILKRAKHYLLQDGDDASSLLSRLNELAAQRETEIEALRQQENKAKNILNEQKTKLAQEKKRLQENIRDHMQELMKAWKSGKTTAKQAIKSMSGLRAELGLPEVAEDASVLPKIVELTPGQKVFHTGLNKSGIVTDVDDRRKRARVDMNGVSLWTDISDLRLSAASKEQTKIQNAVVRNRGPVATLDVRGQRASEAIAEVERFLDNAMLADSGEIEIVHGRGTGALRREIHAFLRSFPAVESIALAPEDRGGDGMTIVKLK